MSDEEESFFRWTWERLNRDEPGQYIPSWVIRTMLIVAGVMLLVGVTLGIIDLVGLVR